MDYWATCITDYIFDRPIFKTFGQLLHLQYCALGMLLLPKKAFFSSVTSKYLASEGETSRLVTSGGFPAASLFAGMKQPAKEEKN